MGAILPFVANSKSDMLDPGIRKRLPQQPVVSAVGIEPTEEEIATAMKAMTNEKAVGPDRLPVELLKQDFNKIGPSCWSSTNSPPSSGARGKSTAVERRGHYSTPQKGRQDGLRKLPRHLARFTRG